jgi:hypothetical protein
VVRYSEHPRRVFSIALRSRWRVGQRGEGHFGALRALAPAAPFPGARSAARAPGQSRPSRAAARRRLVLGALVAVLAACVLAGLSTGSTVAWWCMVAVLPLACSYLALLAWVRRLEVEREFNTAFLNGAGMPDHAEFFAGLASVKPVSREEEIVLDARKQLPKRSPTPAGHSRAVSV